MHARLAIIHLIVRKDFATKDEISRRVRIKRRVEHPWFTVQPPLKSETLFWRIKFLTTLQCNRDFFDCSQEKDWFRDSAAAQSQHSHVFRDTEIFALKNMAEIFSDY
jgi:hypothetical protein